MATIRRCVMVWNLGALWFLYTIVNDATHALPVTSTKPLVIGERKECFRFAFTAL